MRFVLFLLIFALVSPPAYAVCSSLGNATVMKVTWNANGTGTIEALDTASITAVAEGVLAYDTTSDTLKVCDGASWMTIVSADNGGAITTINLQPRSSAPATCNAGNYGMVALNNVTGALTIPQLCVCANGGWKVIGGLGTACPW